MADKAAENVTDETRLQAIREFVTARRKAAAAAALCSQIVQKYKKLGVNPAALRQIAKMRDQDPDEVLETQREVVRMSALLNMPMNQEDLFPGDEAPLPTQVQVEQSAWEAEDAGYLAGKAGRAIDSSPYNHQPGSELFVKWRDGWQKGQEAIAYEMGPDTKQASDERRPRGGRKKDATDPAEGTA